MFRKLLTIMAVACLCMACGQRSEPDPAVLNRQAPEVFRILFHTTKGEFELEATRAWSPLAVDRLYQLVLSGYYTNNLVFRVEPNYIVQFGVAEEHAVKKFWYERYVPDEPVQQPSLAGTVAFARNQKGTRSTQLFINMADNPSLDTMVVDGVTGFPPVARVVKGMDVLGNLFAKYGSEPATDQVMLYRKGNTYYEERFPGLDKILYAKILP